MAETREPPPITPERALAPIDPKGEGVYLGSTEAVETIIRAFLDRVPDVVRAGGEAGLRGLIDAHASRFTSGAEGDGLVPGWHTQPRLGRYVARRMGINEDKPLWGILRDFFTILAGRVLDQIEAEAEGGKTREQIEFELEAAVEEATAALTGTWEMVYPPEEPPTPEPPPTA